MAILEIEWARVEDSETADGQDFVAVVDPLLGLSASHLSRGANDGLSVESPGEKLSELSIRRFSGDAEVLGDSPLARKTVSRWIHVGGKTAEKLPEIGGHLSQETGIARVKVHLDEHARFAVSRRDVDFLLELYGDEWLALGWGILIWMWIHMGMVQQHYLMNPDS